MKTVTAYDKFVSKVNALDTSRGVNPDVRQFVFIFNEEMQNWISETQNKEQGNVAIEGMQELIEPYRLLAPVKQPPKNDYVTFLLPDDFFIRISARVLAYLGECTAYMTLEFTKPTEVEVKQTSSFHRSSFEMEQALGFLANNTLNIFGDGKSTIKGVLFSYYRLPEEIDLEGYINEEGIPSATKDTQLSTFIMNQIIDRAATEFYIRNTDQVRTALSERKN